jgi:hypothetical protein
MISFDFFDPVVCFTISGASPSTRSQNRIGKLRQRTHDSSSVQDKAKFRCIAFRRQVASQFARWRRSTVWSRMSQWDSSLIKELPLKHTCRHVKHSWNRISGYVSNAPNWSVSFYIKRIPNSGVVTKIRGSPGLYWLTNLLAVSNSLLTNKRRLQDDNR